MRAHVDYGLGAVQQAASRVPIAQVCQDKRGREILRLDLIGPNDIVTPLDEEPRHTISEPSRCAGYDYHYLPLA